MAKYNIDPKVQINNLAYKIANLEIENARLTAIVQDFSKQIDEFEKKQETIKEE